MMSGVLIRLNLLLTSVDNVPRMKCNVWVVQSVFYTHTHRYMARQLFFISGYSPEIIVAALEGDHMCRVASYPSGEAPSFLALHPSKPVLYAVNEVEEGKLEAFEYERSAGKLSRLGAPQPSFGDSPAAISVHPSGKWLLFANYSGGNYGTIGIDPDTGCLVPSNDSTLVNVEPMPQPGPNASRQDKPHPHQIVNDSTGKFIFVCDLGKDVIHQSLLDTATGKLLPNPKSEAAAAPPGSGPRHIIFAPNGSSVYCVNELSSMVNLYAYDSATGTLRFIKGWSTLDDTVPNKEKCLAAEIVLSPDCKFLYASNRGNEEDTIAVFRVVNQETGELCFEGLDKVGGSGPRHFSLDPSGEMLVVALQNSKSVSLLRRNKETGRLSWVSSLNDVTDPTFIQFF